MNQGNLSTWWVFGKSPVNPWDRKAECNRDVCGSRVLRRGHYKYGWRVITEGLLFRQTGCRVPIRCLARNDVLGDGRPLLGSIAETAESMSSSIPMRLHRSPWCRRHLPAPPPLYPSPHPVSPSFHPQGPGITTYTGYQGIEASPEGTTLRPQ